jgi:hypothetical protein
VNSLDKPLVHGIILVIFAEIAHQFRRPFRKNLIGIVPESPIIPGFRVIGAHNLEQLKSLSDSEFSLLGDIKLFGFGGFNERVIVLIEIVEKSGSSRLERVIEFQMVSDLISNQFLFVNIALV